MSAATTPDAIIQKIVDLLTEAPDRPLALQGDGKILDHDLLPVEEEELPVLGIYLADDKKASDEDANGGQDRVALVRVEIRAIGPMLRATRDLREWAIRTLLQDPFLGGLLRDLSYSGFTPFGATSNKQLAGADLDFEAAYFWLSSPVE
jgi:hypothetical protein